MTPFTKRIQILWVGLHPPLKHHEHNQQQLQAIFLTFLKIRGPEILEDFTHCTSILKLCSLPKHQKHRCAGKDHKPRNPQRIPVETQHPLQTHCEINRSCWDTLSPCGLGEPGLQQRSGLPKKVDLSQQATSWLLVTFD